MLYFADFNEDGLKALDTATALNDRIAIIWRTRGFLLRDLGRNDEALKSFGRTVALVRDPATSAGNKPSWGLIPRARLLQKPGRSEEARQDVAEVVAKEGRDAVPNDLTELE